MNEKVAPMIPVVAVPNKTNSGYLTLRQVAYVPQFY